MGRIRWSVDRAGLERLGRGRNALQPVPVTADVDLDGRLEIVAGATVYRADGSVLWRSEVVDDGFPAPIDLDDDPYPEIVVVRLGQLFALDHDGSRVWGPVALPGGPPENKGGPPAVADLDLDGSPEILVADRVRLAAFHADGSLRWQLPIADATSKATSVSLFDFEGDGAPEVVHADQAALRIIRGRDGGTWWTQTSSNGTQVELPVIADVDADGHAEILRVADSYAFGGQHGIEVYGMDERWLGAPTEWTQHAYVAGGAAPGGRIPRHRAPSWLAGRACGWRRPTPARSPRPTPPYGIRATLPIPEVAAICGCASEAPAPPRYRPRPRCAGAGSTPRDASAAWERRSWARRCRRDRVAWSRGPWTRRCRSRPLPSSRESRRRALTRTAGRATRRSGWSSFPLRLSHRAPGHRPARPPRLPPVHTRPHADAHRALLPRAIR